MTQRRQEATDVQRQEAAQRTLGRAQERAGWKERYETMRRGRNKTVMIGRQRDPRRAHLEGQMARLQTSADKKGFSRGFCQVRTLADDLGGRIHRVHIMDIAHPDVDGAAEHVVVEVSEATWFLANNIPHGMAVLTEAMQIRVFYEQRGETIPTTELVGPWKRWAEEEATRAQTETSKADTNTESVLGRTRAIVIRIVIEIVIEIVRAIAVATTRQKLHHRHHQQNQQQWRRRGGGGRGSGEVGSGSSGRSQSSIAQGVANSGSGHNRNRHTPPIPTPTTSKS
jgi:hypothetical protein